MEKKKRGPFKWQMLELPDGITTSNGSWYHITTDEIEKYTPGLLEKHPVEKIIRDADAWLKSADSLSLVLFFVTVLVGMNTYLAALFCIVFFVFWYFNTSAFVVPGLGKLMRIIQTDAFIYLISASFLVYFSYRDLVVVWVGLSLFFLFKVGLLRLAINYLNSKSQITKTPTQDRILNMLLIRYAMKEGILTGNVKEMEQEFLNIVNYHKKKSRD